MGILKELQTNKCTYCHDQDIKNGIYIDIEWRDNNYNGCWPKPYQESGLNNDNIKAVVIGQDPTIEDPRPIEYALEVNKENSNLGVFLREVFGMLPSIKFNELYFTDLIKCRFKEKPGKGNRNISRFLDELAKQCFSTFLEREIIQFKNARYLFTLGRDCFNILAGLLHVKHRSLTDFKDYYGKQLDVPLEVFGRSCYLIPLPHQPTYDLAKRYSPYSKVEVERRLKDIS